MPKKNTDTPKPEASPAPPSPPELAITKQVASKMTGFGFPNSPFHAKCQEARALGKATSVYELTGLTGSKVFALVVKKAHKPEPAYHVVDFRIGQDIY